MITITNFITKLVGKIFGPFLHRRPLSLLVLVLLLSAAPSAHAQIFYAGPASGDWATAAHWNPAGVPGSGAAVGIGTFATAQGAVTVTLDSNYTSANALGSLTLNNTNSSSTDLVQNNSSDNMDATTEIIGFNLTGNTYDQSAGTNTVGNTLTLGFGMGSGGAYNLSGTGTLNAFVETIGGPGTGTLTQSGTSSNTAGFELQLGVQASGTGTYNLEAGTLAAANEVIGGAGTGTFTQSATSSNAVSGNLQVGVSSTSAGSSYTLQGGSLTTSGNEYIGAAGAGTFTQSGASSNTITSLLDVGEDSTSTGIYNFSGHGTILQNAYLTAGSEIIGDAGNGTFNQSGTASNTISGTLILGNQSGSNGTYNLTDAASLSAGNETIGGQEGQGTFIQSGTSSNTISGLLQLGIGSNSTSSTATYQLSGAGTLTADNEDIGVVTTGPETDTFTQSGTSSNTISGLLRVGVKKPSNAAYNLGESGTLTADNEDIGWTGHGTFTQSGTSSNTITNLLDLGVTFSGLAFGTYNLEGGNVPGVVTATLSANSETIGDVGNGTFTQSGNSSNSITGTLTLGNSSTGSGTYTLSDTATLSATNETIANLGTGTFTQTGSSVNGSGTPVTLLDVGASQGGLGVYNLGSGTDSPTINANVEIIGDAGTGTFTQYSGTNTISGSGTIPNPNTASPAIAFGTLILGNQGGSTAAYSLQGGTLTAANETIGAMGTGIFAQSGNSSNAITGSLTLGDQGGSVGTYELDRGTLTAPSETIGNSGSGTFTQKGGTNTVTDDGIFNFFAVAFYAGSKGQYNLEGGVLNGGGSEAIGALNGISTGTTVVQPGDFDQTGGTNIASDLVLGIGNGGAGQFGSGTYELSGTVANPAVLTVTTEEVGSEGTGVFTQGANSTHTVSSILDVGVGFFGTQGTFKLEGGTLSAALEFIGLDGIGTFTQSGTTSNTITNFLGVGEDSTSTGTYTLSDTATLTAANEAIGGAGAGTFTQTGTSANGNSVAPVTLLDVGAIQGSRGMYNLGSGSDAPTINANVEIIGDAGAGAFTQQSGTNTILGSGTSPNTNPASPAIAFGTLIVGNQGGNLDLGLDKQVAQYSLQGGTLNAATELVGYGNSQLNGDSADFNQTGGSNAAVTISVGTMSGSVGTYELNSTTNGSVTTVLTAVSETIGDAGTGTFTQSGSSSNSITGALILGNSSTGIGTYNLEAGALSANGETIGGGGTGTFAQTGGTNSANVLTVSLGNSYTLNNTTEGATPSLAANLELVTGNFIQEAGTNQFGELYLENSNGGINYRLSGGNLTGQSITINSGAFLQQNSGGSTLTVGNTPGSFVIENGGEYDFSSGTESGYIQNYGTIFYTYQGNITGTLENETTGTLQIINGASLIAGQGVINYGTISLPTGTLGSGAAGTLDNEAEIALSGGGLGGAGAIVNNDLISGYGTIGGSGGFTNNGTLTQGAGLLTLSNTGTNTNNGEIDLTTTQQFRITGATLTNEGVVNLNTASVVGTGMLINDYAGNINGPGTISSAFLNNGTLLPGSGQLTITNAWTNNGLVELTGVTSSIKGGLISNTGTIQGFGTVGSAVTNDGIVEAIGGTLDLSGVVSNKADGAIYAGTGDKVLAIQGIATNAGLINLTGGTYDNNSHAMSNTGEISGYGTFRTGGLTTSGSMAFAGGTSTVNGSVTETGGTIDTYNPTTFTNGATINGGTFTTHEAQTIFAGSGLNINGGTFHNDPSPVQTTNLNVASGGTLTGVAGSLYQVSGNVSNASTGFQLAAGGLELVSGATNTHTFTWSVNSGVTDIGTLTIDSGQQVNFQNGGNTDAALFVLSFQLADGLSAANPTALQSDISADLSGTLDIFYANNSADAYLDDKTYNLTGGGLVEPDMQTTPEPSTWSMLLGGLGLLAFWRLRRTKGLN